MKLLRVKIGNANFFVNEEQIKEAGGKEQAAKKLKSELFPEKEAEVKPEKHVKQKPDNE